MRALVISSDGYQDKRIERILTNNNINGDIATKLTRNDINVYDCVIFSHKNDIPNLPKLIETIVLHKQILVVYINNTASIGYYYNLIDDLYFNMINEPSLEIELPIVIKSSSKYLKQISRLEESVKDLKDDLQLLKKTNKAKNILMSKGLSEEQSHKFIQQKSMSMRVSKIKLVNLIIENKIDI